MGHKDPAVRKAYQKEYRKLWYAKNKARIVEKAVKRNKWLREEQRAFLDAYKLEHGCRDCGYNIAAVALDFDHLEDKQYNVSQMGGNSWKRILQEINKCEVVCANCHRIRTQQRRNASVF